MAYEKLEYKNSAELCEQMAAECDTCILAFSTGKDSIAAWLQLRKYFKHIIPYYCYLIPCMEFVEESLKYYEDFFETHIYRLPHKSFYRMLNELMFQTPKNVLAIEDAKLPDERQYNDMVIGDIIRYCEQLSPDVYAANGVRMADSPMRRISIKTHGAISHNQKRFFPVYDWKKADLVKAFDESGVKLPVDYHIWGRTFDGIDYRFLKPLKDNFPNDYQKLLDWFPLAELEIARREGFETIRGKRS